MFMTVVGKNLARLGVATQSSTSSNGLAQYAIDGNLDGDFKHHSCARTSESTNPWWKVTFKDEILLHQIIITNRADCCGTFLSSVIGANTVVPMCPSFSWLGVGYVLYVNPNLILGLVVVINYVNAIIIALTWSSVHIVECIGLSMWFQH